MQNREQNPLFPRAETLSYNYSTNQQYSQHKFPDQTYSFNNIFTTSYLIVLIKTMLQININNYFHLMKIQGLIKIVFNNKITH
jgi:hypothetical protein